jgi:hypothetical protein
MVRNPSLAAVPLKYKKETLCKCEKKINPIRLSTLGLNAEQMA